MGLEHGKDLGSEVLLGSGMAPEAGCDLAFPG